MLCKVPTWLKTGLLAACVVTILASTGQAIEDDAFDRTNMAIVTNVVLPLHERFAESAASLKDKIHHFCVQHEGDASMAQAAFKTHMLAFQRVRPFTLAPLLEGHGIARFQFWPDKRGNGGKQLRRTLNNRPSDVTDATSLSKKSVALNDLQAMERLLFDDVAIKAESFECRYAAAIASHQAEMAIKLEQDWSDPASGFVAQIAGAQEGTDSFYDAREAAAALYSSLVETIEFIIDEKIERAKGDHIEKARPKRTENYRSSLSMANIKANLSTAQAMFLTRGGFTDLLAETGNGPLGAGIARRIGETIVLAEAVSLPLHQAIIDKTGRDQVNELLVQLKSVRFLLSTAVGRELDLGTGFNASDGD